MDYQTLRLNTAFQHYGISVIFDEAALDQFPKHVFSACTRRRLFVLAGDEIVIGIGPGGVKPGDAIVQLVGALTPFVLRPIGEWCHCVGECFIHEEMPGSTKTMDREATTESREFVVR